jgi:hypothetical protein
MSKFDDNIVIYKASLTEKAGVTDINEDLLIKVTKALGPSIYLPDASKVSCSDQTELDRVKNNFLIKKLGMADAPELDAAIKEVCDQMGSSNKSKYRAVFNYLLTLKLGKSSFFLGE